MRRRPSPLARFLRHWHTRLGIGAAVFLLLLALTGLVLNHGDTLGLDQTEISTPWLMNWYGLKTVIPENGFRSNGEVLVAQGDNWALNGKRLKQGHGDPVGFAVTAGQHWVATASELLLYQADGRLIDRVDAALLPTTPLRHIGIWKEQLVLDSAGGFFSSEDGISWQPLPKQAKVAWIRPDSLTDTERQQAMPLFKPRLPVLRIVADLHSGRVFGSYGPLATDTLAILLIFFAISGSWLHLRKKCPPGHSHSPKSPVPLGQ
ncbi:MAG: hypothetical protein EKK46_13575 [Rhodocyclaceae bacterium]|nr:MAG: hypothetical protein EKK46_13575 [Rhodocyclaceae bacterium]